MTLAALAALALTARNLAIHHSYCRRFASCDPDWVEAIALGWLRPRCKHCRHTIS